MDSPSSPQPINIVVRSKIDILYNHSHQRSHRAKPSTFTTILFDVLSPSCSTTVMLHGKIVGMGSTRTLDIQRSRRLFKQRASKSEATAVSKQTSVTKIARTTSSRPLPLGKRSRCNPRRHRGTHPRRSPPCPQPTPFPSLLPPHHLTPITPDLRPSPTKRWYQRNQQVHHLQGHHHHPDLKPSPHLALQQVLSHPPIQRLRLALQLPQRCLLRSRRPSYPGEAAV
jgi:hypothetical protein